MGIFRIRILLRTQQNKKEITNLPTFSMNSFLRRREDIQNIGKIGNLNMNHMVIYIIRRGILR